MIDETKPPTGPEGPEEQKAEGQGPDAGDENLEAIKPRGKVIKMPEPGSSEYSARRSGFYAGGKNPAAQETPKTEIVNELFRQAIKLISQGQTKEALIIFKKILESPPFDFDVLSDIGNILLGEDYPEEAIKFYAQALKAKPNHAPTNFSLGNIYDRQEDRKNAISNYERAVRIDPNYAAPYFPLAIDYFLSDRLTEALEAYAKFLELAKDDSAQNSWMRAEARARIKQIKEILERSKI